MTSQWLLATVRHGETDFNKQGRYAGSIDVALNEAGRSDARSAAPGIQSMRFDLCATSPYLRALETAQILTEGRIEIVPSRDARERDFGILQGLTSEDVERIRPPIRFIRVGGDYHSIDLPGGETFEALRARALALHLHLSASFTGRRVLVVSHGVFLQQLHGVLRGQDWMEALGPHVGNLELTVFQMEGDRAVSEERRLLIDRKQVSF